MNKKGSIVIEATLVMTIVILIIFLGIKELIRIEILIKDYFDTQEEIYQEMIEKNIKELRIEKAMVDGK